METLLLSHEERLPFNSEVYAFFSAPFSGNGQTGSLGFYENPPLGITVLASYLNSRGVSAQPLYNYFSLEKNKERLIDALRKKPLVVGVSTTHIFTRKGLDPVLDLVRRKSPGSLVVLGGPGAEWNRELRAEGTVTVLGSGERTLLELIRRLKDGADFRDLPGISFWEGGELKENPAVTPVPLDELPFPDWGLYPEAPDAVSVQSAGGCSRRCGFCSYSREPRRVKSVGRVLAEVANNRKKYGLDFFRFMDADFPSDRRRALAICRGVKEIAERSSGAFSSRGLSWSCYARTDSLLDPELASAMKNAGCLWVYLGIESGSDRILSAMNKGMDAKTQLEAVKNMKAAGLLVHANFVVGYPGETEETLKETMAFIRRAPLDTIFFSPFHVRRRSSPVWEKRLEYGLKEEGGGTGWKHSTMNSKEAIRSALELMRETALTMDRPLLGTEMALSYADSGSGEKFTKKVFAHFEAIRDWHRARKGQMPETENTRRERRVSDNRKGT